MKISFKISPFTLYQAISAAFCVILVISNIISAKMISLPYFQVIIPAGLITYPLTFLLSDLVTEIFGTKKAKTMVYIAFGTNIISFAIIQCALWIPSAIETDQAAFNATLGLSCLRIFSSLTAYMVAQLVDIQLYAAIKQWTNSRFLWLRNNGSTLVSQFADTVIIDLIFLYWGLKMPFGEVGAIMAVSIAYKTTFSLLCTPLFYFLIFLVKSNWSLSYTDQRSQVSSYF